MIDLEFIERLIRTLDASGLDHVEIERGGTRIRVSRTPGPAVAPPSPARGPAAADAVPSGSDTAGAAPGGGTPLEAPDTAAASAPPEENANWVDVPSPMVGTFYRSPTPDSDPFIEVGGKISTGDTLCIIEAMKLMNELEAEIDGIVREVLVENGEPVEYGQVLFRVEVT